MGKNDSHLLWNLFEKGIPQNGIGGVSVITIYKNKKDIPHKMEYIELNDVFFNQNTAARLDDQAKRIVEQIDEARLLGKYKIESKFNGVMLDVDCLSTGCKTVLNVLYFSDKVFCIKECGDNALDVLYSLDRGAVYSDYAIIPFEMGAVRAVSGEKITTIEGYVKLKEWWEDEM